MNRLYILLVVILLTVRANAQTPNQMTYQAVVRDASNILVASTEVGIQISILKGSESGSVVYSETQQPTTNTNGLISIIIGTPPNSDLGPGLSQIDWSNDIYFIKTEIDPTGGSNYTITGTTQLLSVPYALYAKSSGDKVFSTTKNITSNANGDMGNDDFVFGATQLEGAGTKMFFDKSKRAFRAGSITSTEWDDVNIGFSSIATGENTIAESYAQISLGINNTEAVGKPASFEPSDRLFVIGNGVDSSSRSDAMVVLKDGTITAPSLTNELINKAGSKALTTKEYIDNMLQPKTYAIGDFALGGVVFWVDETGQHGLVCSLEDIDNGAVWMNHDDINSFNVNFTSGNGIGAGKLNTAMILSSIDVQKLSNTTFAALLCATYSKSDININNLYDDGGGTINISYGDWYLPSVYELSMIYPNKDLISSVCQANGGEGLSDKSYWSSNQYSQTAAWVYVMSGNSPSPDAKNYNYLVRAVRSF
ncbi:MAG: DUF1566 domain-containing protein [Flavobacteriaceae bacterium]|nr:DUF1566 domain-containing protein [Flavobacteriaceae bacterium]